MHVGETPNDWTPEMEVGPVRGTRSGYESLRRARGRRPAGPPLRRARVGQHGGERGQVPEPLAWSGRQPLCNWGFVPPLALHTEAQGMAVK
jgi:hypothetical protein